MSPKQIMQKYRKRIMWIMTQITEAAREAGFRIVEFGFIEDDYYSWQMLTSFRDRPQPDGTPWENDVTISVIIAESEFYAGSQDGVNFIMDIVEVGGRIVGGFSPFNYTDEVWVSRKDKTAVEERFRIFEGAIDPADIVRLLEKHKEEAIQRMPRIPPGVKEWRP